MEMTPQLGYIKRFDEYYPDFDPSLNGIGGWLVLVIISHIISIILSIKNISDSNGYLGLNPKFDTFFIIIILLSFISIVISAAVVFFIFKINIFFRKLYVIECAIGLLFGIFELFYLNSFNIDSSSLLSTLIGSLVGSAIWIAYMYKSKRVKNTYIYPKLYQDYENTYGYVINNPAYPYPGNGENLTMSVPRQEDIIPKASATSSGSYNISDIQIPGTDQVRCPVCNAIQLNNREFCYNCLAKFIH